MGISKKIIESNDQPQGGRGIVGVGGSRGLDGESALNENRVITPFPPIEPGDVDQTWQEIDADLSVRYLTDPQYLLSAYGGSSAAYSLRSLSKSEDPVVRLRRGGDSTESDFTAAEIVAGTAGSEMLSNGDFATDTIWNKGANWTITGGQAVSDGTANFGGISQNGVISDQAGVYYLITFDVVACSNFNGAGTVIDSSSIQSFNGSWQISSTGTYSAIFKTTGTNSNFSFYTETGTTLTIDNVSCKPYTLSAAELWVANDKSKMHRQSADSGYVTTWYDQSGSGNDATQAVSASQPLLIRAGVTNTVGGKVALDFDGSNDDLSVGSTALSTARQDSFLVMRTTDTDHVMLSQSPTTAGFGWTASDGSASTLITSDFGTPTLYTNGTEPAQATRDDIHTALSTGSQVLASTIGADTSAWSDTLIAGFASGVFRFSGEVQEFIIYPSDQSHNRLGIEANINAYYSIYEDEVLDLYGGAFAAYSVDLIRNSYRGPVIEARRVVDDATRDFTARQIENGTLQSWVQDGGQNATISKFYDQTGNGRHATAYLSDQSYEPFIAENGQVYRDINGRIAAHYTDYRGMVYAAASASDWDLLFGSSKFSCFATLADTAALSNFPGGYYSEASTPNDIRYTIYWPKDTLSNDQKQNALEMADTYKGIPADGKDLFHAWDALETSPYLDFTGVTNFQLTYYTTGVVSLDERLDFSSATTVTEMFRGCESLTETPRYSFTNCTDFTNTWEGCTSLTSFPWMDFRSGTNFSSAWKDCTCLTDFEGRCFADSFATNLTDAFTNTNLSQDAIDSILSGIDSAGQSGGTFDQSGGSAPSAVGEAAIDRLIERGWAVIVTGGYHPILKHATAGYSLRDLDPAKAGQSVVRLRRAADGAESDFTAAELVGSSVGSQVIINPEFDSATGWSATGGWSITGGQAVNSGANGNLQQGSKITVGVTYIATIEISACSNFADASIRFGAASSYPLSGLGITSTGTHQIAFEATSTFFLLQAFNSATMTVDFMGCEEYTPTGAEAWVIDGVSNTTQLFAYATTWYDQSASNEQVFPNPAISAADWSYTIGAFDYSINDGRVSMWNVTGYSQINIVYPSLTGIESGKTYRVEFDYENCTNANGFALAFQLDGNVFTIAPSTGSGTASKDIVAAVSGDVNGWLQTLGGVAYANGGIDITGVRVTDIGNPATQSASTAQPLLIRTGVTETDNTKAAMVFDGVDDELSSSYTGDATATFAIVANRGSGNNRMFAHGGSLTNNGIYRTFPNSALLINNGGTVLTNASGGTTGAQALLFATNDGAGNGSVNENGGTPTTGTLGTGGMNELNVGGTISGLPGINSYYQELVFYPIDQSANRVGIETNINSHYNIY